MIASSNLTAYATIYSAFALMKGLVNN